MLQLYIEDICDLHKFRSTVLVKSALVWGKLVKPPEFWYVYLFGSVKHEAEVGNGGRD
jgi:hypothetical protein